LEASVPLYLGRFAYTAETVARLVENPQDRGQAAVKAAESVGAKLLGFWYALGEWDGYFLVEAPDNATAAALSMVAGGSGALARTETIALLTVDEAQEAMRKAGGGRFVQPS
jgi:uncharacterized protein with GYD domain